MGRRLVLVITCWLALAAGQLRAEEPRVSVILKGNLTTSSQIFPNPNATDDLARSESFSVSSVYGYGLEVRYHFAETNVAIGLSADYLHATTSRTITARPAVIPVDDGYRVIPVELTGYFLIPVSGPTLGVFMGGGVGAYIGHREYSVGGQQSSSVGEKSGWGIHVLGGVSYRFSPRFMLVGEMKFRDLQFESTNEFSSSRINYRGTVINVERGPFESSIHTDGMVFQLGAAFTF